MIIFARILITICGLFCILTSYTLWDITREFFNPFYVRELFTISLAIKEQLLEIDFTSACPVFPVF